MTAYRRASGQERGRGLAIGLAAIVGALFLVVALAEHGSFSRFARSSATTTAIPSMTIGDDDDHMPVVTSVRSDGAAERAGIRVGDEIAAIDGKRVRDVATLRSVMASDVGDQPLALHIRRGDAVWTIAIDRSEAAADDLAATGAMNGAENPAD